jgi:hypothetical protein
VAGSFGVLDQCADLARRCRRVNLQLDVDPLEERRFPVNVVLLGVEEGGPNVSRGVEDRDLVQRREPRRLGEQSKGGANHQVLQWAGTQLSTASSQGLIRLDNKTAHAALEMDVLENARDRASRDTPLVPRPGANLGA